jgi:DNA-directed RNA polymerase
MDSETLTIERFARQTERTAGEVGWGSTVGALGISERYISEYITLVSSRWEDLKPIKLRTMFQPLGETLIALSAMTCGFGLCVDGEPYLSAQTEKLGKALEQERYGYEVSNWDKSFAKLTEEAVKKARRSSKYRKALFRSLAQKKGFKFERLSRQDTMKVGAWLLSILVSGPVFRQTEDGPLTLSEEALAVSDEVVRRTMELHPVLLPVKAPPEPWEAPTATIQGHHIPLVRTHDKFAQKVVSASLKAGFMSDFMEAVSIEQSVSYRINLPIVELVRWCYENGVKVEGLPPKDDLPIPEHGDWEAMSDVEKRLWKVSASTTRGLNRSYLGQRLMLQHDLAAAEWLGDDPFWTHCNVDYRGRMYPLPSFNFQRGDYVRAMFKFAKGKPLGERGLYWLKVHLANCGDFGKVSKKPFDERVKWVEENEDLIFWTATAPKDDLRWTEADSPFLFVAACQAYMHSWDIDNYHCDIPISFDGSCSGLQHLGAMTRDEGTCELVNLTDTSQPQDVYQVVADSVKAQVEADLSSGNPEVVEMARRSLAYGIDRKLVKRNVMTFSYSSQKFGMAEQHREDTMQPLKYEVMRGSRKEHPFGGDDGYRASIYLAGITYDAIERVVHRPAQAMRFLREIALVLGHEGRPLVWHTPLGLPVVLRYPKSKTSRVYLWLSDKGVKTRVKAIIPQEAPGIDKRRAANAIAPSFVHSLDANHLHCVVLSAKKEGIDDLALVHDSFGCQAGDAERVREIIKEEFKRQYQNNDVLFDIWREAHAQLHTDWYRLPPLPEKGNYDINEVMNAEYAFA